MNEDFSSPVVKKPLWQDVTFYVAAFALIIFGLVVRNLSYPIRTDDYIYFIKPWFETLQAHTGLTAFATPFSNYAPLYLYFLKLLGMLPFGSLMSVKKLSVMFDVVLALTATLLVRKTREPSLSQAQLFLVFALLFALPTLILDGALWAQCDVIYAAFAMLGVYFMLTNRWLISACMFGISLALKIQGIFIFPIIIGYYWRKRQAGHLLLVPIIYILSIIPAWLGGGSFKDLLLTYLHQSNEYKALSLSAPSLYSFFNYAPLADMTRNQLALAGVVLAGLISLAVILYMKFSTRELKAKDVILLLASAALLFPLILPRMHERYFFMADIFILLYAFCVPRRWYLPVIATIVSICSYSSYLSKPAPWLNIFVVDFRILAAALVVVFAVLSLDLHRLWRAHPLHAAHGARS